MDYFAVWAASVIQQNLTQIVHVLDSHCIYKAKANVRRKHQKCDLISYYTNEMQ